MSLGGPLGAMPVPSLELQATATNRMTGANLFIGRISDGFGWICACACEDPGGDKTFYTEKYLSGPDFVARLQSISLDIVSMH
jgi:hypothetical protein